MNENQGMEIPAIQLNAIVQKVFTIKDVTMGTNNDSWIFRYRGELKSQDSISAYDELKEQLSPAKLKPLFRIEKQDQVIYWLLTISLYRLLNPIVIFAFHHHIAFCLVDRWNHVNGKYADRLQLDYCTINLMGWLAFCA